MALFECQDRGLTELAGKAQGLDLLDPEKQKAGLMPVTSSITAFRKERENSEGIHPRKKPLVSLRILAFVEHRGARICGRHVGGTIEAVLAKPSVQLR